MKPIILPPKRRERHMDSLCRAVLAYLPGKPIRVRLEEARPDRTPAQNRYLWAVPYRMLSEATGFTEDELHEYFCGNHWGWKDRRGPKTPRNPTGLHSVPIRTTTRNEAGERDICSRDDLVAIWESAQRVGAEMGIVIPDPDPDYWRRDAQQKRQAD